MFSVGGTDSSPEEEEEEKEVAGGFAHHSDRRDASRDARASTALRLGRRLHPEQRRGLLVDPHRCVFALCVTRQKTKGVFLVFVPSQLARLTYLYRRYYSCTCVYFISYESINNMIIRNVQIK